MRHSKIWRWAIPAALLAIIALIVVVKIVLAHANPILKGRVVETLRARFNSDVQLDNLQVSIGLGLQVTGSGLRIFPRNQPKTPGNNQPLIAIQEFRFSASPIGLFLKPTHVRQVNVSGLEINMPPCRSTAGTKSKSAEALRQSKNSGRQDRLR